MENSGKSSLTEKENGYLRCLCKVIERTQGLLVRENVILDYGEIHSTKTILYAAIEQAGMSAQRLIAAQEKLRELLFLVAIQNDASGLERQEALRIIEDLKTHFHAL